MLLQLHYLIGFIMFLVSIFFFLIFLNILIHVASPSRIYIVNIDLLDLHCIQNYSNKSEVSNVNQNGSINYITIYCRMKLILKSARFMLS